MKKQIYVPRCGTPIGVSLHFGNNSINPSYGRKKVDYISCKRVGQGNTDE